MVDIRPSAMSPGGAGNAPSPAAQGGEARTRILLANTLLRDNHRDSPEHARGLAMLQQEAEGGGSREACWFLGAYYLQVTTWTDAHAEAARWLERAAVAGVAPAIDRLANLFLQGIGVAYSLPRALELQRHLADAGFQQAAWETGYLLDVSDDAPEGAGASAFARACALGYPPAYYALGLRMALARGERADRAFARALLLRAADGSFPDARAAADELVPEREVGPSASDWHRRLKDNLAAARGLRQALTPMDAPLGAGSPNPIVMRLEAHFAAIGHPSIALDADGRLAVDARARMRLHASPQAWDWLAQCPRIAVSRGFATREECAHLMHKAGSSLRPPEGYLKAGANDESERRQFNGQGHPRNVLDADGVVRMVERRIAAMAGWTMQALEPHSVIRYLPGNEYKPHVDSYSPEQIERNRIERGDHGGQRTASFLLYLHAPEEGGETYFHFPDLPVRGERGMGLLHYNAIPDGSGDAQSLHSGRPVVRGEKWIWRSTLRQHSLYPSRSNPDPP